MASQGTEQSEELLRLARAGDQAAVQRLMTMHRDRLRRSVAVRMDPRLAARVDGSDVVQETLMVASRRLSGYLENPQVPFYVWLRRLAQQQLADLADRHIRAQKRSVAREQPIMLISDESAMDLADRLIQSSTTPSHHVRREEMRARVRRSLGQLEESEREVLVMRHLEQLSISEISEELGISEAAVKMRRLRAIQRLRQILDEDLAEPL